MYSYPMVGIRVDWHLIPVPCEIWRRSTSDPAVEPSQFTFLYLQVTGNDLEGRLVMLFSHLSRLPPSVRELVLLGLPAMKKNYDDGERN